MTLFGLFSMIVGEIFFKETSEMEDLRRGGVFEVFSDRGGVWSGWFEVRGVCDVFYARGVFFNERSEVDDSRCVGVFDVFYDHGGVFFEETLEVEDLCCGGDFDVFYDRGGSLLRWKVWDEWFETWGCLLFSVIARGVFFDEKSEVDDLRCGGICDVFYGYWGNFFKKRSEMEDSRWGGVCDVFYNRGESSSTKSLKWMIWDVAVLGLFSIIFFK